MGSARSPSSLMTCPCTSMNRSLPSTRRTVRLAEVFSRRSVPVSRAGDTMRSLPFSTRSVTFRSTTSPVMIPDLTVIDGGVTGYVRSSITTCSRGSSWRATPPTGRLRGPLGTWPDAVRELGTVFLDRVGHRQAAPDRKLARRLFGSEEYHGAVSEDEALRMTLTQDADDNPAAHDGTPPVAARCCAIASAETKAALLRGGGRLQQRRRALFCHRPIRIGLPREGGPPGLQHELGLLPGGADRLEPAHLLDPGHVDLLPGEADRHQRRGDRGVRLLDRHLARGAARRPTAPAKPQDHRHHTTDHRTPDARLQPHGLHHHDESPSPFGE